MLNPADEGQKPETAVQGWHLLSFGTAHLIFHVRVRVQAKYLIIRHGIYGASHVTNLLHEKQLICNLIVKNLTHKVFKLLVLQCTCTRT